MIQERRLSASDVSFNCNLQHTNVLKMTFYLHWRHVFEFGCPSPSRGRTGRGPKSGQLMPDQLDMKWKQRTRHARLICTGTHSYLLLVAKVDSTGVGSESKSTFWKTIGMNSSPSWHLSRCSQIWTVMCFAMNLRRFSTGAVYNLQIGVP